MVAASLPRRTPRTGDLSQSWIHCRAGALVKRRVGTSRCTRIPIRHTTSARPELSCMSTNMDVERCCVRTSFSSRATVARTGNGQGRVCEFFLAPTNSDIVAC